jgi:hypothetical protein
VTSVITYILQEMKGKEDLGLSNLFKIRK